MARRKAKRVARKPVGKAKKRRSNRTARLAQSRTVSFFIGIITVIVLAFLIFQYAQNNNYKQVLGDKTQILKQTP